MMNNFYKYIIALSIVIIAFSCVKEEFRTGHDTKLNFSTDTIFFDTVFTNVGSTTAYLKLFNPYEESVKISSISLGRGSASPYRINVNGESAPIVKNIELAPKDSIYILVEVTVNPNDISSPFVVKDSILCNVNGAMQNVKLMAWGQNANYIDGRYNGIIQTETWTSDKPYLIYNSMLIDSLHTLTMEAGTRVYLHKGAHIIAKGNLNIQGTFEEPVFIQGDRMEESYQDTPGQWGNIILADGSGEHHVEWAVIKNGVIGFQLGSVQSEAKPILKINNSKIQNMDYACVFSMASTIKANNCLISNSGYYLSALLVGGNYDFNHCTFANYWNHGRRFDVSLLISNNFRNRENQFVGDMEQANFNNCIIYGDNENEITISNEDGAEMNYHFKNTLLRVYEDMPMDALHFESCIKNKDPRFIRPYYYKFELDTLSPAKDVGFVNIAPEAEFDLNNVSHLNDLLPDLGAYERQE